ncbi:RNase adapter RapZ [bacterium]|nr:RNase adapter RapZ [bacterium]
MPKPELILLSGLSGSGKTTALHTLEDLGYSCVDNLPGPLFQDFVQHYLTNSIQGHFALLLDSRTAIELKILKTALESIRARGAVTEVIFLDAHDDVICRRFQETRRPHPLIESECCDCIPSAIQRERELLADFRSIADRVVDTSSFSPHQLRNHIESLFAEDTRDAETRPEITLVSFGFKHGIPQDLDLMLDVRFLPNPHFVPELRELDGRNAEVANYVLAVPDAQEFLKRYLDFLAFLIPRYRQEGKRYLRIGLGCTGGQHRSVALTETLAQLLYEHNFKILQIMHRDIKA